MTKKVLVIGLGLIGGSIALAVQKAPNIKVLGYDLNEKTRELAKTLNVVHEVVDDIKSACSNVDFIIFGTPVNATLQWIDKIKNWDLKKDVIITDTGSTKTLIMEQAKVLKDKGITFIGGHPMAGSHKSGIIAAKPYLFESAYYLLTPFEDENNDNITKLINLLKFTFAKIIQLDAKEHDHMTAVVSHFPHIVAASLVHQLHNENQKFPLTSLLAAGGFRDITRIASSNPQLWTDIVLQNRDELMEQLDEWLQEMDRVKKILTLRDMEEIEQYFAVAKKVRDELPISTGAFYTTYDLYVDIPDYPGVISEVTGYLAEDRISITNIRIVEAREDIFGILVISFQNAEDRERAVKCIKRNTNFETYIA